MYICSPPLPCACFARAAAINRIKQRLEALRTQTSLVLDLEHLLVPADMRLTMRDVSLLLGPCVRLQTALDTGVPVVSPAHACMSTSSHTHPRTHEWHARVTLHEPCFVEEASDMRFMYVFCCRIFSWPWRKKNQPAVAHTQNALKPVPTSNENEVLRAWICVLTAIGKPLERGAKVDDTKAYIYIHRERERERESEQERKREKRERREREERETCTVSLALSACSIARTTHSNINLSSSSSFCLILARRMLRKSLARSALAQCSTAQATRP